MVRRAPGAIENRAFPYAQTLTTPTQAPIVFVPQLRWTAAVLLRVTRMRRESMAMLGLAAACGSP